MTPISRPPIENGRPPTAFLKRSASWQPPPRSVCGSSSAISSPPYRAQRSTVTDLRLQRIRHALQNLITDLMAMRVVHVLELIDVDNYERARSAEAVCLHDDSRQPFLELLSVGEPGKCIGPRPPIDLLDLPHRLECVRRHYAEQAEILGVRRRYGGRDVTLHYERADDTVQSLEWNYRQRSEAMFRLLPTKHYEAFLSARCVLHQNGIVSHARSADLAFRGHD